MKVKQLYWSILVFKEIEEKKMVQTCISRCLYSPSVIFALRPRWPRYHLNLSRRWCCNVGDVRKLNVSRKNRKMVVLRLLWWDRTGAASEAWWDYLITISASVFMPWHYRRSSLPPSPRRVARGLSFTASHRGSRSSGCRGGNSWGSAMSLEMMLNIWLEVEILWSWLKVDL